MMTKTELEKLRARLPRGYYSKLMKKTHLSKTTIYYALNGIRENDQVLEAAARLIQEREQIKSEILDIIHLPNSSNQ
ncbi:MAG: hypothetical protein WCW86_06790 [Bacteroidales bacterium]